MSELYELPKGWQWKELNFFGKFIRGVTYSKDQLLERHNSDSLTLLRANNIQNELNLDEVQIVPKDVAKGKEIVDGDILFAMSSGSKHLVGKNLLLNGLKGFTFGAFCSVYRNKKTDLLDNYYLSYVLKSNLYREKLSDLAMGANINNLKSSDLEIIPIPLPPLSEQQRVVSKLDSLFKKIDKAIALHQKNIDEADAFMGSALNEVFEELEVKHQHTKLKNVVAKEKTSIKRGPFGSALKKSFFVDNGYLVYEQFHALNNDFTMERYFIDEEKFNELKAFEVKSGDIIISCSGVYLGKLAIVPNNCTKGIINQALLKLTLDRMIVIDKFFVYFWNNLINNGFFDDIRKGAAIPNMPSVGELKEIDIPLPQLSIQQKVVSYLDDLSEKIERVKVVQKMKMDRLKALKASILDKAFRGEL